MTATPPKPATSASESATTRLSRGPVSLDLPVLDTVRPVSVVIALVCLALLLNARWSVLRTLTVGAVLGLLAAGLGLPT